MIGVEGYKRMVSTIRLDLLELFGKSYILDHIKKEIRNHDEIQFYRDCVADAVGELAGVNALYSYVASYTFPFYVKRIDKRSAAEITEENSKALEELCGGGDET